MYVIILLFLRTDIPKMRFYNAGRKDLNWLAADVLSASALLFT